MTTLQPYSYIANNWRPGHDGEEMRYNSLEIDTYRKKAPEVIDELRSTLARINSQFGIPRDDVEIEGGREAITLCWWIPLTKEARDAEKEKQRDAYRGQIAYYTKKLEAIK